jgi:hypothetical protein
LGLKEEENKKDRGGTRKETGGASWFLNGAGDKNREKKEKKGGDRD